MASSLHKGLISKYHHIVDQVYQHMNLRGHKHSVHSRGSQTLVFYINITGELAKHQIHGLIPETLKQNLYEKDTDIYFQCGSCFFFFNLMDYVALCGLCTETHTCSCEEKSPCILPRTWNRKCQTYSGTYSFAFFHSMDFINFSFRFILGFTSIPVRLQDV